MRSHGMAHLHVQYVLTHIMLIYTRFARSRPAMQTNGEHRAEQGQSRRQRDKAIDAQVPREGEHTTMNGTLPESCES